MDSEKAKDAVLQYLYEQQTSFPMRQIGYSKAQIMAEVRGFDNSVVGLAVDYLEDEGFLRTQTRQGVKYFRLSSKAQDKLLSPSMYSRNRTSDGGARIFNDGGVIILGDNYGAISIEDRQSIASIVDSLVKIIESSSLGESEKVDLIQSASTIHAQINRPTPDRNIIHSSYSALQVLATLAGASDLVHQLGQLINTIFR